MPRRDCDTTLRPRLARSTVARRQRISSSCCWLRVISPRSVGRLGVFRGPRKGSYLPNINLKVQSWFLWRFFIGRDWGIMRVPWKQSHLSCLLSFLNKGCLDFFSFWQCGVLRQRFPHARELRPGCWGRDSWDTNWRRVINSYNLHMWFD